MKTLGGLILPDTMVWTNRKQSEGVVQSSEYSLGGNLITYSAAVNGGASIVLEAKEESCWVQEAWVDEVIAMSALAGLEMELSWLGQKVPVVFDHEANPAVLFNQIWDTFDAYTGTIKLKVSR